MAIAASLFALVLAAQAAPFDLQAHRGGRGLRPENTLASFENAVKMGVTTLELDIAITADGVPVISHDPFVNPAIARDAQGRWLDQPGPLIHALTLAELQTYELGRLHPDLAYGKAFPEQQPRDGLRFPTLASLFALVRELGDTQVQFDIETKIFPDKPGSTVSPEEFVKLLLPMIREAGMTRRSMIESFDWRTLQLVQVAEPALRTVYLTIQTRGADNVADPRWTAGRKIADYASLQHMIKAAGGAVWAPLYANVDVESVRCSHELGLQVVPWTVNDLADMRRRSIGASTA